MASVDYRKLEDGDNTAAGPLAPPFQLAQLDNDKEGLLKGLNDGQVAELVKKYGLNEVPEEKEPRVPRATSQAQVQTSKAV
eukprot:Skav226215  [mRNA]  locus=scaffold2208:611471:612304:- [translate_table: standard]